MKKAHDYYSFICHRSQDKPFALKLQKKIERYKIPSKLGFSTKYARHVFVDKNELRKPELKDELIEAVMKSDNLIVLCSPTSASPADGTKVWGDVKDWSDPSKTGWIGFEISRFMEKNPERPYEHIIPIVIDGDPEKGDCFHPLLLNEIRQQNLKWYDFREKQPYDDAGRVVRSSYFDADGMPAKDYHTDIYFEYDECGHLTHIDPMANGRRDQMYTDYGGLAYGEARQFDERGNMVERAYLKADGGILLRKVTEYNDDCLPVAEMYYDGTGTPASGPDQYWKKSIEYDEKNNETSTSYFDTDGKPLMLAAGYSQVSQEYDADNVQVGRAFLDKDGNLVNCLAGYAYCEQTVTEWRSTSKIAFYDKHERELFSYHIDYNKYGQKTAEWLAGPDGAYLNHPTNKLAMTKYFYDDNRQRVREEYYDEEGNPANLWDITSGWVSEYSEHGFEVKRTNLGDGFEPAPDHKQITTAIFSYDDLGREIERTFWDENGNEHNCVFGFSRYQVEYGDDGEIEHTAYWNENGEEVTGLGGSVEKVTLTMHNGDYEIKKTELGILAFVPVIYNVNRISYRQGSDYDLMLPYSIPFSVDRYAAQIISGSLKKYAKAFDGDALDIKTMRADGAEIEALLDRYLDTLRKDGNLTELFYTAIMESAANLLAPYASKLPTKAELMDFYQEFYHNEWAHTKRRLQSEYGEDFILSCQITDLTEFSESSISENRVQFDSYNLDAPLEDMVTLEVKYMVEGNGKSAALNGGLFYPRVTLLKFGGSWTLGTAEGFPAPATEDFAALFGITL